MSDTIKNIPNLSSEISNNTRMNEIINHLKKYGFIFQGSEIYGGLANSWDFGPMGSELKKNIKELWWNHFIRKHQFNSGFDSSIILNSNVWKASHHIDNFSDLLVDCKECKFRFRADHLIAKYYPNKNIELESNEKLNHLIQKEKIKCPKCKKHNFTEIRNFNLMFRVMSDITDNLKNDNWLYLRPETAQGIFINFDNIQRTVGRALPFGIGQIGKAFRNEITPSNYIFRTREFEQMEMEFFYSKYDKNNWFEFWLNQIKDFLKLININDQNLIFYNHSSKELAHYAKKTIDIKYKFPFGDLELWGLADRSNYDLKEHSKFSNKALLYVDPIKHEKYFPYVIEPSVGVERLFLAIINDAYTKENIGNKERIVLKIAKELAPYKIAILPLAKKLSSNCQTILEDLSNLFSVHFNEVGSIGKRYVREDAIGTPFCITFDYDSLSDAKVTIRNRDDAQQERIEIKKIKMYFLSKFNII